MEVNLLSLHPPMIPDPSSARDAFDPFVGENSIEEETVRRRHTVWPDSGKRYSSMNAWILVHGAYPLLLLNYLPVKQQTSKQPFDDTREDRAVLDPFRIGTGRLRFFC